MTEPITNWHPLLLYPGTIPGILAGTVTMTHRVMNPQPWVNTVGQWLWERRPGEHIAFHPSLNPDHYGAAAVHLAHVCPWGKPGDGLWGREAWRAARTKHGRRPAILCEYKAMPDIGNVVLFQGNVLPDARLLDGRWRPSIHMPRWACRIYRRVIGIKAERIQDISFRDWVADAAPTGLEQEKALATFTGAEYQRNHWRQLWDSIYAKPKARYVRLNGPRVVDHYVSYPWGGEPETREHRGRPWIVVPNPWTWAITFELTDERPSNA